MFIRLIYLHLLQIGIRGVTKNFDIFQALYTSTYIHNDCVFEVYFIIKIFYKELIMKGYQHLFIVMYRK